MTTSPRASPSPKASPRRRVIAPSTGAAPVSIGLHRRRAAALLATLRGGVLNRPLLASIGVDADAIEREIRNDRWRRHGWNTVATHTSDLPLLALQWRAVWETNEATAVLDGVSALIAAGLKGFKENVVHVSVLGASSAGTTDGVTVHRVTSRPSDVVLTNGVPRTRPEVAAIRAAQWAVSDRQAALLLAMTMQQRLTTPDRLLGASLSVRGRTRRKFIPMIVQDVTRGAHSLGELDFVAMCRRHGLPEPALQKLRTLPDGSAFLDAAWDDPRLAVEIDGRGHTWGLAESKDHLRQNEITLGGDPVLRMNLVGLRLYEEEFMAQIRAGLSRERQLAS